MSAKKLKIMKSKPAVTAATEPKDTNKYAEATNYIESAIQALSKDAKAGDSLAKESIANLSVVLLDLK